MEFVMVQEIVYAMIIGIQKQIALVCFKVYLAQRPDTYKIKILLGRGSCANFSPIYLKYSIVRNKCVGPAFINFGILSWPYGLIKGPTFINFWNFF